MTVGGKRGPKPLTARDWVFGSRPRRLALRFVLTAEAAEKGWSKAQIARGSGVGPHGGADEHIEGLLALELLVECNGRYWPVEPPSELGDRIEALLDELEAVPEKRVAELLPVVRRN
jgi:hypothetical protein